jgi:hypothetical protein
MVLERAVSGNVRFFGSNLRATHNLARNIAKVIKQSELRGSEPANAVLTGQPCDRTDVLAFNGCRG